MAVAAAVGANRKRTQAMVATFTMSPTKRYKSEAVNGIAYHSIDCCH